MRLLMRAGMIFCASYGFAAMGSSPGVCEPLPAMCQVLQAPEQTARLVNIRQRSPDQRCSFDDLFVAVRDLPGWQPRGEFETSREYAQRIERLGAQELLPSLRASSSIAVVLPIQNPPQYDPDAGVFKAPGHPNLGSSVTNLFTHDIGRLSDRPRSFYPVGQQSHFEAYRYWPPRDEVRKLVTTIWAVVLEPELRDDTRWERGPNLVMPVRRDEAPHVKEQLVAFLVGRLNTPATYEGESLQEGAWSTYDVETKRYALSIHPQAVWIVRADTGEVLAKPSVGVDGLISYSPVPLPAELRRKPPGRRQAR